MPRMRPALALLTALALGCALPACGASQREPTATPSPTGPTPTPRPLYAVELEGTAVRSLCVDVRQSYPGVEDKDPEPIADGLTDIVSGIGIRVLAAGGDCDADLTIVLEGEPMACDYQNWGECHSGARVKGQMALDVPGFPAQEVKLQGWYNCPYEIRSCAQPADAPYGQAWTEALLRGLAQLWGPEIPLQALDRGTGWEREVAADALGEFEAAEGVVDALASALGDRDSTVRLRAAESLVDIGPDAVGAQPALIEALADDNVFVRVSAAEALGLIGDRATEAVPALIQALDDPMPGVRKAAATALRHITGESFGEDVDAWQAWLQDTG